jgi:hypothetical protein
MYLCAVVESLSSLSGTLTSSLSSLALPPSHTTFLPSSFPFSLLIFNSSFHPSPHPILPCCPFLSSCDFSVALSSLLSLSFCCPLLSSCDSSVALSSLLPPFPLFYSDVLSSLLATHLRPSAALEAKSSTPTAGFNATPNIPIYCVIITCYF